MKRWFQNWIVKSWNQCLVLPGDYVEMFVEEGPHNNSPTGGLTTLVYIHLMQHYEEQNTTLWRTKYKINKTARNDFISRKTSPTHNILLIHIITKLQDVPNWGTITYYRALILIPKYWTLILLWGNKIHWGYVRTGCWGKYWDSKGN